MSEAPAVTGYDLVECVDDRRRVHCAEHLFHRPRQPDLGQERDAAPGITGDRSSVAEDEPKASEPRIFGHAGQKAAGFLIVQGKERNRFVSVEPDDDTRPPSTELSGAVIEKDRAKKAPGGDVHAADHGLLLDEARKLLELVPLREALDLDTRHSRMKDTTASFTFKSPGSVLPDAGKAGLTYEQGAGEAREAPGDQVAVVRVADSGDDEEYGRGDEEQSAKTKVHRGSFRDWQELYARVAHPANAC